MTWVLAGEQNTAILPSPLTLSLQLPMLAVEHDRANN